MQVAEAQNSQAWPPNVSSTSQTPHLDLTAPTSRLGTVRQQPDRAAQSQDPQAWMGRTLTVHKLDAGRGNYAGMPMPVLQQGHRHALRLDLPAAAQCDTGAAWTAKLIRKASFTAVFTASSWRLSAGHCPAASLLLLSFMRFGYVSKDGAPAKSG